MAASSYMGYFLKVSREFFYVKKECFVRVEKILCKSGEDSSPLFRVEKIQESVGNL